MSSFDFDTWRDLALRDPDAFFKKREQFIQTFIEANKSSDGLIALQRQIDNVRALAGTPLNAVRELSRMLGERLEMLALEIQLLENHVEHLDKIAKES